MIVPDPRIAEVVRRLTDMPGDLDPFDVAEWMAELEAEFDAPTVRWAIRFVEASEALPSKGPSPSEPGTADPLYDSTLDG